MIYLYDLLQIAWEQHHLRDLALVSWVGSVLLICADPAQHPTTAGEELDHLCPYVDDLSVYDHLPVDDLYVDDMSVDDHLSVDDLPDE